MAKVIRQIITTAANRDAAIALAMYEGQQQTTYNARATTDPLGGGVEPTHYWCNGPLEEGYVDLCLADPANYTVTAFPSSQALNALSSHIPQLYKWYPPPEL